MTHPYLDHDRPIGLAHRGGAREFPENSLTAFQGCLDLGISHIETDVRATVDGVPVIFHDETLERVTDRVGRVRDLPFNEVGRARIGGADPVASLESVLGMFPQMQFNLDIKEDNAVEPTLDVLERTRSLDRVGVAAFSLARLRRVRQRFGNRVCTALAPQEVAVLLGRSRLPRMPVPRGLGDPTGPICVQIPPRAGRLTLVEPGLIRAAHDRGWPVHVWTVDDPAAMRALLAMGVDGLISDRPTILRQVLYGFPQAL